MLKNEKRSAQVGRREIDRGKRRTNNQRGQDVDSVGREQTQNDCDEEEEKLDEHEF